jgi:hypothetical protein
MDKFSSKVHRVHMELGGQLSSPVFLKALEWGSLENVAEIFVLFLCDQEKRKTTHALKNRSPQKLKERSRFGIGYRITPSPKRRG